MDAFMARDRLDWARLLIGEPEFHPYYIWLQDFNSASHFVAERQYLAMSNVVKELINGSNYAGRDRRDSSIDRIFLTTSDGSQSMTAVNWD